ncbi:hypothetical protein DOK78_000190 [Enterococcus sp. DIV2402]|uniref:YtxH domain-containing protein n=1 Tax=Candidatus Enterococcus lowellii TaxID=2230877 RepID=A0ABZ2SI98_9ENTE|nr:YtxH domain-containing protein [Enterococcus sp. DIV2402]MBO0463217.1 YtxH domain-containing protein [Enterococcus sp. DIV2402]
MSFIKGLLFGATVGGVSGLLMAPRSGKETQQMVETYIDDVTESTKEFNESLQNFQQALAQTQKTVEETIPYFTKSLQKDVEAFKFQAAPRLARINEQVEEMNQYIASLPVQNETKKK